MNRRQYPFSFYILLIPVGMKCLILAAGLQGCIEGTVIVDGTEREYALYLTSNPCRTPKRLVFFFHGARENDLYATKLYAEAGKRNYLLVGLQGIENEEYYYYNSQGDHEPVTGWALSAGLDDAAHPDLLYFDAVLEDVRNRFPIDEDRIHLVGFSNGAFFLNMMAGYRSMTIASMVAASGGMDGDGINKCGEQESGYCFVDVLNRTVEWLDQLERKYPVFLLAGEADPLVSPDHARRALEKYVAAGWSETRGLDAPEVRLRLVSGLGHDWPRGWNNCEGYDATSDVFDFFDTHSRQP